MGRRGRRRRGRRRLVGDDTFTRHMVEHVLLGMVVPFLVALAAPVTLALQAGGPATRRGLRRALHSRAGRAAGQPGRRLLPASAPASSPST